MSGCWGLRPVNRTTLWENYGYCLFWACCAAGCGRVVPVDGPVSVVPAPVSVTPAEGVFRLSASTRVVVRSADERMSFVTDALDDVLRPIFGRGLTVWPRPRHRTGR